MSHKAYIHHDYAGLHGAMKGYPMDAMLPGCENGGRTPVAADASTGIRDEVHGLVITWKV